MSSHDTKTRPVPDQVLTDIADYVTDYQSASPETYRAARYCLMDALSCAVEALNFPECTKMLGPVVPGIICPHGARVPGTKLELDPVTAAFNITNLIRWLDFNDAFAGHPSDTLGGIFASADYLSRSRIAEGKPPLLMREILDGLVKAYELHGVLSLENNFPRATFDVVLATKIATTAVVTHILGGSREEIVNAVSNAWADGGSLVVYRHGQNTGPRKSWAGGDACARGVQLALMALKGEMGYPTVLTAKTFGFYDVFLKGQPLKVRPYGSYVLENVAFKFVPAGMHGQTAVECAFQLHPLVKDRLDDIEAITLKTQKSLLAIMDKKGPLTNPAARDHCAQYVVAVALIHGKLNTSDFEDEFAADPRIDRLREKMTVVEEPQYTLDQADRNKLSRANALEVRFKDGSSTPKVEVEYTIGHPRRRAEAIPMMEEKFRKHIGRRFPQKQQASILQVCLDQARLEATPVNEFMGRFVI